jgi:S-adenosylmethionine decarboxylase proenzyme
MYRAVIELDAPDEPLDSERAVRHLVEAIVNTFDLTLIAYESTRFEPIGVTGFGILGESHISVHTWPEYGYAHVELLTCVPLPDSAELRARFPLPDETVVEVRRCEP